MKVSVWKYLCCSSVVYLCHVCTIACALVSFHYYMHTLTDHADYVKLYAASAGGSHQPNCHMQTFTHHADCFQLNAFKEGHINQNCHRHTLTQYADCVMLCAAPVGGSHQPAEGHSDHHQVCAPHLCCCPVAGAEAAAGCMEGQSSLINEFF